MQLLRDGFVFNFFVFTNNIFMSTRKIMTDMALEFCKTPHKSFDGTVKYYEVDVDTKLSKKLGRPVGKYLQGRPRVLCVGLGNPDLTADALGDRVFKRLNVNRHVSSDKYVCAITPNVLGMTGIESIDVISAVADKVKPDVIIAVDALTAAAPGRIASAFQVTDSGITPGSGVFNHRPRLDKESLGCKVVSVGVPLVVLASTIAREFCENAERDKFDMIVTPREVDILVDDCAQIISDAVNAAFESLTE